MIQSVIRYSLTLVLAYLVGKGVITQDQSNTIMPTLAQDLVIIATGVIAVVWSFFEKDAKGVLDAYFPSGKGSLPPSIKSLVLVLIPVAAMSLVGCASTAGTTSLTTPTGSLAVPTKTLNTANTIANLLQNFNTGLTNALPTVSTVLTQTHNSGDVGIAQDVVVGTNLVTALVTAFNTTVQQAAAAGATPAQVQAAANATLAPTNVAAIAANVVAASPTPTN